MAWDQMRRLLDVPIRRVANNGVSFGHEARRFLVRKISDRRNAKLAARTFDIQIQHCTASDRQVAPLLERRRPKWQQDLVKPMFDQNFRLA